jgi:DNA polymerase V
VSGCVITVALSRSFAASDPAADRVSGPGTRRSRRPGEPHDAGAPTVEEPFATDLNELLIRHPTGTVLLRVCGDSMVGGGIHPGDLLVVDRHLEPRSGHIVVALIDGAFTVKRLVRRRGAWWLEAAHPAYPAIRLGPAEDVGETLTDRRVGPAARDDTTAEAAAGDPGEGIVDACLWGVAIHAIRRL